MDNFNANLLDRYCLRVLSNNYKNFLKIMNISVINNMPILNGYALSSADAGNTAAPPFL